MKRSIRALTIGAVFIFGLGNALAQKVTVDSSRHIHYGSLSTPAVFPIVLYDFNSNLCNNPSNELSLISQLSVDTVIDVVCDSASAAQNIAKAMQPLGLHLWSTVAGGIGYSGSDPGFASELAGLSNVTGYFITDEPQSAADLSTVSALNKLVAGFDSSALRVTSFNDGTFGGSFPNYGGGSFNQYDGTEITMDVLGNGPWNDSPPRSSNGLYDVTWETQVWDGVANTSFPNVPLITDIAYYGPPGNTTGDANCYLTLPQTLSEAWAAVVNNTDGLAWWAIGQGETGGADMCDGTTFSYEQIWNLLVQATSAVHSIASVILSPADGWYTHAQAESVVQTAGRQNWIFASNITQNSVSDTFSGLPSGSTVTAYAGNPDGSNRTICTSCGSSFTDTLPGFTADAYEISSSSSASPAPTSSLTTSPTPSSSTTPSNSPTPSPTPTNTASAAPTPTRTPTPTPTPSNTIFNFRHRHYH